MCRYQIMNSLPEFFPSEYVAQQVWWGEHYMAGLHTINFPNQVGDTIPGNEDLYNDMPQPHPFTNASFCHHAHLYALYHQPFVDFVTQNVNAFQGADQWYFVIAAAGLIDYVGFSADINRRICSDHLDQYNYFNKGFNEGMYAQYSDVREYNYRKWFVAKKKYTNTAPLYSTCLLKSNKMLPRIFVHGVEDAANAPLMVMHKYTELFAGERIRHSHSPNHCPGEDFNRLMRYLLDKMDIQYPCAFFANGIGLAFIKRIIMKVLSGEVFNLEDEEVQDGDWVNPYMPFALV